MARLTAKQRAQIPSNKFALPDQRKYPIDTPGRAADALRLVGLNGTPAQKAKVRAAVKKTHPTVHVSGAPAAGKSDPGMKPPAKKTAAKKTTAAKPAKSSTPMRRSGGKGK